MNNLLITICARGGSKGIPGKNIKEVCGRPLLAYTIQIAQNIKSIYDCDIILSSDSNKILEVGSNYGLTTDYVRPDFLANDTCGKVDAIRDALLYSENKYNKKYDYIIDLDVTSPIRTVEDVINCLNLIEKDENALTIFSVNKCVRNPYFNQVQKKENGYYSEVIKGSFLTRQSAPEVYDMNASIYVYKRRFFDLNLVDVVTDKSLIYEMNHICFDLDEPMDYEYLSFLLSTGKIKIG